LVCPVVAAEIALGRRHPPGQRVDHAVAAGDNPDVTGGVPATLLSAVHRVPEQQIAGLHLGAGNRLSQLELFVGVTPNILAGRLLIAAPHQSRAVGASGLVRGRAVLPAEGLPRTGEKRLDPPTGRCGPLLATVASVSTITTIASVTTIALVTSIASVSTIVLVASVAIVVIVVIVVMVVALFRHRRLQSIVEADQPRVRWYRRRRGVRVNVHLE